MCSRSPGVIVESIALRCLIVDDNPQFLRSARSLLEREGMAVVGLATTGAEALEQAGQLRPDVLLVDIDLGQESGFEVARQIVAETGVSPANVVLTSTRSSADFADLIAASALAGFVSKADLSATAVCRVVAGGGQGVS